jgi:hypothetical protein
LLSVLVMALPLATGCANMNNTQSDALGGGLIGAAVGAIAGGPRHALEGAAIGGAVGAGTGAVIGHSEDKAEQRMAVAQAQAQARMLGLTDIAQMARDHQSDDVIIGQIRATGSVFRLSTTDLQWLKENGVSDRVVNEMQATVAYPRRYYARPVYVEQPPPVVYVEPAPPPPVAVGVGIGIRR